MRNLRFYDKNFNKLFELNRFISLNHSLKLFEVGTSELHLSFSQSDILDYLLNNKIIIMTDGEFSFIVTGYQIGEDIAVFLRSLNFLMDKRIATATKLTGRTPSYIVQYFVQTFMSDFIGLGSIDSSVSETMDYEITGAKSIYNIANEVLAPYQLGFSIEADFTAKTYRFSIYKGATCSIMLSESLKTAFNQVYTFDMSEAATAAHYEKETVSGSSSTSARDYIPGNTTGIEKWETVLSGKKSASDARQELLKLAPKPSIDTEVRRLEFGTDYHLGSTVTVQFEKENIKKAFDMVVIGVDISYDSTGKTVTPILEAKKGS